MIKTHYNVSVKILLLGLYIHLSKLIIDPPILVEDDDEGYSNCLRLRTNHQSTVNIAKATNFIVAPKPTYLQINRKISNKNPMRSVYPM